MSYLPNTPLSSFLTKEQISYINSLPHAETRNNGIPPLRLPLHRNKRKETNNQSIANYVTNSKNSDGFPNKWTTPSIIIYATGYRSIHQSSTETIKTKVSLFVKS